MGNSSEKLVGEKPVVVIVGAGYAGVTVARLLDDTNKFNVVLIDRKNYFLHNIAAVRAAVDKDFAKNVLIPYSSLLKNSGVFLRGSVSRVERDHVIVHSHPSPIPFNYLVITTGSSYAFPSKVNDTEMESALNRYHAIAGDIEKSSKIVIVGGGAVGAELAAEIAFKYKGRNDKQITLIHSHGNLIRDDFKPEFHSKVKEKLESKNVRVLLGERVQLDRGVFPTLIASAGYYHEGDTIVTTDKGTEIPADLILMATGTKLNTATYKESLMASLTPEGRLRTNEYLQVDGYENIFAAGDCQGQQFKMAYFAKLQAEAVAKNIQRSLAKKPLESYTAINRPVILLSLGPDDGVSQFHNEGGTVVGGTITSFLVSKDLAVGDTWKELRMNAPKLNQEIPHNEPPKGKVFESKKEALAHVLHVDQEEAGRLLLSGLEPMPIAAGQDSL